MRHNCSGTPFCVSAGSRTRERIGRQPAESSSYPSGCFCRPNESLNYSTWRPFSPFPRSTLHVGSLLPCRGARPSTTLVWGPLTLATLKSRSFLYVHTRLLMRLFFRLATNSRKWWNAPEKNVSLKTGLNREYLSYYNNIILIYLHTCKYCNNNYYDII